MWQKLSAEELERQYDARASVSDFDAEIARYRELSAQAYNNCDIVRDLSYGPAAAEKIDYFTAGAAAPVLIFIHGGYWRLLGRQDSALFAQNLAAHGISTAVVEYTLAPAASLDQIVAEVRRATAWIFTNIADYGGDPERLYVCGSSAGAHLAAMALAANWQTTDQRSSTFLKGGILLSGLYDLEPLIHCKPNTWLKLDHESARRNSPQAQIFKAGPNIHISWGGLETDEFKRQSVAFSKRLNEFGLSVTCNAVEDRNHFDIVADLSDPERPLFKRLLEMLSEHQP